MRIVYMGTPDFAVESLKALVENGFDIVGVVTMPDKPAGRGHKIQFSPVKQYALSQNLPLLQPTNLKDDLFLADLKALKADLQIVVAFRMLPEIVWDMPRLGTFNLHASLLPQYRGAAPINWAIINGEIQTGVSTFFLQHTIDTGDIILQKAIDIEPNETAGTLHDKLMYLGAELVVSTAKQVENDTIVTTAQQQVSELKIAPKIFKETCRVNFSASAHTIDSFVRGLSPYPAAWFELTDSTQTVMVKVYSLTPEVATHTYPVSTLICDGKKELKIAVPDGFVHINELQLAGKKRMLIEDLLRGNTAISQMTIVP